jgi:ABC-2 type transport system permease protein
VIRVFGYLVWRSGYNRMVRQLRHLRSPRYVAALLLGAGYLWIILIDQRPAPAASKIVSGSLIEIVGALALLGAVAWGWIFGLERRVLAFSPAEVTFLFSAPISRRGLIQFKLLRNQLLILFNTLLWTLILSRERFGASPWLRSLSIWILLTTLSFHRLGASFVRTSLAEHGRYGVQHRAISMAVLAIVCVALGVSLADALPALEAGRAGGTLAFLSALASQAERPLPRLVLWPFITMVRPLSAGTTGEWLHSVGPAVALLVLHAIWVVRSDSAFEEAAAEASLNRARAASDRRRDPRPQPQVAPHALPGFLALRPAGWRAGAILWKNVIALLRIRRTRSAALAVAVGGAIAALFSIRGQSTLADIAGWLALTWAGVMLIVGPQWVRNDLRGDLTKLDLLRSYPLRGSSIIQAEVAASALALTLMQLALLLVAYLAFIKDDTLRFDLAERTLLLAVALIYLPLINYVGLLIHNAAAILFPAWVHLGVGRPGGVEALGQNMLMIIAFTILLAATLAVPTSLGGSVVVLLQPFIGNWTLIPATVVLLGTLAIEALLIVRWLGRVFESTDPASAGLPA